MEIFLISGLFVFLLGGILYLSYVIKKNSEGKPKDDSQSLLLLQNQIAELNRTLDLKLRETGDRTERQFGESAKIIKDVTEKLTKLDETNRQVVNFADQLQSLQDILKNPKQRGVLGEYYLETLLKNVLPPGSYEMQYALGKDENTGKDLIVDAVVFVREKIIPIDSKFSLENYNRLSETREPAERKRLETLFVNDLKLRIQETAKYIKPEKGTMDFAFMFIPHEAIYYDLLVNKIGAVTEETENLIQRAAGKYHVMIVSPTSFLAYLQTVLQGLKALQIEESAKEIRKNVEMLAKHLESYDEYMRKLGKNIGTTVSTFNDASKEFRKVDKDIFRITDRALEIDSAAPELEKPELE